MPPPGGLSGHFIPRPATREPTRADLHAQLPPEPPLARGDLLDGLHPPSCSRAPRASPDRGDSPGRGG
jgi:hypothetical protein